MMSYSEKSFYAYKGKAPLGKESCGTADKMMFILKTPRGALARVRRHWKGPFRLYQNTNFYDNTTFREVPQ